MEPLPIAALDIGTNSAHLVIAKVNPNGAMQILDTEKFVLRLGKELDAQKNLSESAIARTIEAVQQMKDISNGYTQSVRAVATHATRDAANHQDLIDRVMQETGIHIEIIDGLEEARLSFLGMRQGLSIEKETCLGVDIGGGSTEIILAEGDEIFEVVSVKLGAVTLSKQFFKDTVPTDAEIDAARNYVYYQLSPIVTQFTGKPAVRSIGSSGTAKALAQIHAKLFKSKTPDNANGYKFNHKDLVAIYGNMADLADPKLIKDVLGVDSNRADIILAGTMILTTISEILSVPEWTVSTYSLREGLVIDTYQRHHGGVLTAGDVRWRNVISFGKKFHLDEEHAKRVSELAKLLFKQIEPDYVAGGNHAFEELLEVGAYLHEVGKSISYSRFHRHSAYIISHANLMGFTEEEKRLISYIVKYHRKGSPSKSDLRTNSLLALNAAKINPLAGCLRIAVSLCRRRRKFEHEVSFQVTGFHAEILIKHEPQRFPKVELYRLQREEKALLKAFGLEEIEFKTIEKSRTK